MQCWPANVSSRKKWHKNVSPASKISNNYFSRRSHILMSLTQHRLSTYWTGKSQIPEHCMMIGQPVFCSGSIERWEPGLSLVWDWLTFLINITLSPAIHKLYTKIQYWDTIQRTSNIHKAHNPLPASARENLWNFYNQKSQIWGFNEQIKAWYILALRYKFQLNDINLNPSCIKNYYKLNSEGLQNNVKIITDSDGCKNIW